MFLKRTFFALTWNMNHPRCPFGGSTYAAGIRRAMSNPWHHSAGIVLLAGFADHLQVAYFQIAVLFSTGFFGLATSDFLLGAAISLNGEPVIVTLCPTCSERLTSLLRNSQTFPSSPVSVKPFGSSPFCRQPVAVPSELISFCSGLFSLMGCCANKTAVDSKNSARKAADSLLAILTSCVLGCLWIL